MAHFNCKLHTFVNSKPCLSHFNFNLDTFVNSKAHFMNYAESAG